MTNRAVLSLVLAIAVFTPSALARGGKAPLEPGKYKEWGPDIDSIEIVQRFNVADYDHIVIKPFDTSKAPLPDPKAKWYDTLKLALVGYTQAFAESFQKEIKAKAEVKQSDEATKDLHTLVITGVVEELDPGSRGARIMAGYGAGAAYTKAIIEISDAKSGNTLVRITQARRSAGTWKWGSGSDLDVMRDSVHALGQDVAHVVDLFR